MMYREPSDSPWGLVVRCDTLCPGVYSVSTAGHGGIMAQIDAARQLLSPEAQAVGFQAGGYLNFEEDCDAPVVLRELMDSGIIAPRTDNYFRPGEYEACIDPEPAALEPGLLASTAGTALCTGGKSGKGA